jgi:hypothetical protein
MTYEEARPYLQVGSKIKMLNSDDGCHRDYPEIATVKSINESGVIVNYHDGESHTETNLDSWELEILKNPDGSPWVHPDKQQFKVGDMVLRGANYYKVRSIPGDKIWKGAGISSNYGILLDNGWMDGRGEWVPESFVKKIEEPKYQVPKDFFEPGRILLPKSLEEIAQEIINGFKPKKGFMSTIVEKIKDLALPSTSRILRQHGLEDQNGKMTPDACRMIQDEIMEKAWQERREAIAADIKKVEDEEKECK